MFFNSFFTSSLGFSAPSKGGGESSSGGNGGGGGGISPRLGGGGGRRPKLGGGGESRPRLGGGGKIDVMLEKEGGGGGGGGKMNAVSFVGTYMALLSIFLASLKIC